jgi:tetratricopeptide (TPR) repeat protein
MRSRGHAWCLAAALAAAPLAAQETMPGAPSVDAMPDQGLEPAAIEQAFGDDSWLLLEKGRIAMERGEPGQAMDLFLQARDVAAREVFPEVDVAIGDVWMAEGELAQAERVYLRALDGLRIAPNLLIYQEVDYTAYAVTIRLRLAELYRLRENYGKMEEQYEAIVGMDSEFNTGTLADRVVSNYLEAGLNRVLTLYRLGSVQTAKAHQELGWLYYRTGLEEKAIPHAVFAVMSILSAAIQELRTVDPTYTFVSAETTLQDGYRRPNVRAFFQESGVWRAMYYLAAATYARNVPSRAREIWGIMQRSANAGEYGDLSARQLAAPWVEPALEEPPGARR